MQQGMLLAQPQFLALGRVVVQDTGLRQVLRSDFCSTDQVRAFVEVLKSNSLSAFADHRRNVLTVLPPYPLQECRTESADTPSGCQRQTRHLLVCDNLSPKRNVNAFLGCTSSGITAGANCRLLDLHPPTIFCFGISRSRSEDRTEAGKSIVAIESRKQAAKRPNHHCQDGVNLEVAIRPSSLLVAQGPCISTDA